MTKFLSFVLAAALCAPAFAQKMGMSNNNAPTLTQSISVGGAKMSLDYTSITWASGSTMTKAADPKTGAATRKRINDTATAEPLATFTTSVPVSCGTVKLAAGEYKVYFTITDDCAWQINFQGKDQDAVQTMKLDLKDSPQASKRLLLCLYAGETGGAGVYVAFGNKMTELTFAAAKDDAKDAKK